MAGLWTDPFPFVGTTRRIEFVSPGFDVRIGCLFRQRQQHMNRRTVQPVGRIRITVLDNPIGTDEVHGGPGNVGRIHFRDAVSRIGDQ